MKKGFYPAAIAAITLTLASCGVNDEIIDNGRTAARFTAGIGGLETAGGARAADEAWASGDEIGIFMVETGTTTIAESAVNKAYANTSGNNFATTAGNEIYYPMDGSLTDFIAYYPYKTGTTLTTAIDVEIATTQTTAAQPAFDLLYAVNATGYSKASAGPVNLTFKHVLTKLVMNCLAGEGLIPAELDGMKVTIKGMNTKSTFDLANGTLATTGTTKDITAREITKAATFDASRDAIILPDSYAAGTVTVEFTLTSNETFTWEVGAETFGAGNAHTYEITLNRTEVTATGAITPWNDTPKVGVVAE